MNTTQCKGPSCTAKIIWTVTVKGAHMPVDADPVPGLKRGFKLEQSQDSKNVIAMYYVRPDHLGPDVKDSIDLYMPHWATCPDEKGFRKPGPKPKEGA